MAWDKVTKVDAIAKRKAHTRTNLGKVEEHQAGTLRAIEQGRSITQWSRPRFILTNKERRRRNAAITSMRFIGSASNTVGTSFPTSQKVDTQYVPR